MKCKEMLERLGDGPRLRDDSVPDDQTTDKRLRSLRRQWRVEEEIEEKRYLEQAIMQRHRDRDKKAFYGDKSILHNDGKWIKKGKPISYYDKGRIL